VATVPAALANSPYTAIALTFRAGLSALSRR
jgi:hypothetical protein